MSPQHSSHHTPPSVGLEPTPSASSAPQPFRIYARSGGEQDPSVEQQMRAAKRYLVAQGMLAGGTRLPRHQDPAAGVFIDDGVSGRTPAERPGAVALLADLEAHARSAAPPGILWIWSSSRLWRARSEGVNQMAEMSRLQALGWVVYVHQDRRALDLAMQTRLYDRLLFVLRTEERLTRSEERDWEEQYLRERRLRARLARVRSEIGTVG